jgi:hypothetical protein
LQALPGEGGLRQVCLVEHDARGDLRALGRDQGAGQLRLAEHRIARQHDHNLVEVGGKRFGLPGVLPKQQIAPRQDLLNHPRIAAGLPLHLVAHHAVALLTARVADGAHAIHALNGVVSAVARNHHACKVRDHRVSS